MTTTLEKQGQKITIALLVTQSLFSAAQIMNFTVASIIVLQLANDNSQWAGVPATLSLVGVALTAYPMGRLMDRVGRRNGLSLGYVLGIGGAILAGVAVVNQSLFLFLAGVFLMGITRSAVDLGRYAAAEANMPVKRARAISWVILGGTVGSVLGPTLVKLTTSGAASIGLPEMSGPWFVASGLFVTCLIIINFFLRPDPQEIAVQLELAEANDRAKLYSASQMTDMDQRRPFMEIFRKPAIKLAMGAMICGQLVMVMIMTITPVHMHQAHHEITAISFVIMAHTFGMFGLSFLTGWLIDKVGRPKMIMVGGWILIAACVISPRSLETTWLALGLFLLGLGWNFCYVAGSALLADHLRTSEKGHIQGINDTLISLASATGSLSSGLVFAAIGFLTMNWVGVLVALIPIALVIFVYLTRQTAPLEGAV